LLQTELSPPIEGILREPAVDVHVPALCDIEVCAAFRRGLRLRWISEFRADQALVDYLDLPLTRHGHQALLGRLLDLRENFSTFDATYVALAEQLGASLLTMDAALARDASVHAGLTTLPSDG